MSTPYKVLFDGVMRKLESVDIPDLTEDELDEMLLDYIRPACVQFWACKQDLQKRNDDLAAFGIALTDEEIEILVNFMYIEFLNTNYINTPVLLRQSLISRDFHAFSSRNHLDGLIKLRDGVESSTRRLISVYSNMGSGLFGKLKTKLDSITPTPPEVGDEEEL